MQVQSLGQEDPLEDHGNPIQYSCLDNPHGQRSLVGYSPWDHIELDMTEQLSTVQWMMWDRGRQKRKGKNRKLKRAR